MYDFIKNHWDECLSILAIIVAVLPLLVDYIKTKRRKIYATIVDYRIITQATVSDCTNTQNKQGTILLIAVNLFVPFQSFFVEDYEIIAKTKNGTTYKAIITDGSLTIRSKNKTDVAFVLPAKYNFNLHKEIVCEKDNIRVFQLMLVDSAVEAVEDIDSLNLTLKNSAEQKTISLKIEQFPRFNKMMFLTKFERPLSSKHQP